MRVDLRCRHDPFTPSLWVHLPRPFGLKRQGNGVFFMPEPMGKNVDKTFQKERFLT